MRRQLLINGTLVALALGTLGVVWATRDVATTGELLARKNQLFPEFTLAKVNAVTFSNGSETLELRRDGNEFRIVKPWPERADIAAMNKWLSAADMAMAERPADGVSDERAGFGPSAFRVTLQVAEKTLKLTLGGPAPTPEGARYAKVEADGRALSCVVRGSVASELEVPFDGFRETRMLEYGKRELAKISLTSPKGSLELEQREHGAFFVRVADNWELAQPAGIRVILEQLAHLSSELFVDPTQAKAQLHDAPIRLELQPRDAAAPPVTITIGGSCPKDAQLALLLREQNGRAPRAGCIGASSLVELAVDSDALRLRGPFAAETDEVEELRIVRGAQKLEIARKDKGFVLRAPSQNDVPLKVGNERIAAVLAARGDAASGDVASPGDGEITIQISGGDEDAHREERILLGKPRADKSVCFRRVADGVTRCVAASQAHDLEPDARLLKSLSVLAFAPSELSSFSVEAPDFKERVARRSDGGYQLEEPAGFAHDGAQVAEAVRQLGTLEAERWVAAADEPAFGLSQPVLRVKVQLSNQPPRELVLGERYRFTARYARLSPDPAVFLLDSELYSTLAQPLIDRTLCPFDDGAISRIDAKIRGAKPIALDGPLREAIGALRASGVAHLGPGRPNESFNKPDLELTYVSSGGKSARLLIGRCEPTESPRCYARRDDVDATFTLESNIAVSLRKLIEQ